MSEEQRFEIERAIDLIPHVIGASWAMTYFRLKKIKTPTREEFREKTIDYMIKTKPLMESLSDEEVFSDIQEYIEKRMIIEIEKIKTGENNEVEKRFTRYIDYG